MGQGRKFNKTKWQLDLKVVNFEKLFKHTFLLVEVRFIVLKVYPYEGGFPQIIYAKYSLGHVEGYHNLWWQIVFFMYVI